MRPDRLLTKFGCRGPHSLCKRVWSVLASHVDATVSDLQGALLVHWLARAPSLLHCAHDCCLLSVEAYCCRALRGGLLVTGFVREPATAQAAAAWQMQMVAESLAACAEAALEQRGSPPAVHVAETVSSCLKRLHITTHHSRVHADGCVSTS
jgi:hypothetical protein